MARVDVADVALVDARAHHRERARERRIAPMPAAERSIARCARSCEAAGRAGEAIESAAASARSPDPPRARERACRTRVRGRPPRPRRAARSGGGARRDARRRRCGAPAPRATPMSFW